MDHFDPVRVTDYRLLNLRNRWRHARDREDRALMATVMGQIDAELERRWVHAGLTVTA